MTKHRSPWLAPAILAGVMLLAPPVSAETQAAPQNSDGWSDKIEFMTPDKLQELGADVANTASPVEDAIFAARARAWLLANPEVIVEAMDIMRQRKQQAEQRADADLLSSLGDELFNDGFSASIGNSDADVTIVEFIDYQCGYCKKAHDEVMALIADDPGIRYIVKELPILGPESNLAARVALAVNEAEPGAYQAVNDAFMRHQGQLTSQAIIAVLAKHELDPVALLEAAEGPDIRSRVQRTQRLAQNLNINGTPGFVIGGKIVRGYMPYDAMRELVSQQRDRE